MDYRNLGRTGLKVSPLCMGAMQFGWTADEETSFAILNAALEAGINFIDTANVYSRWVVGHEGGESETILGRWMKKFDIRRDRVVIASKVFSRMGDGPNDGGLSRAHIMNAIDDSLGRLGTDYLDLYQTHAFDPATPIEETLSALDDLVKAGKVRYLGCSNYPAWRLMQALWASDRLGLCRFECLQPHYNLVHRQEFESELAAVCEAYYIGVIPYSPLAAGFLTGKYRRDTDLPESARRAGVRHRYLNEKGWAVLEALEGVSKNYGEASISQAALAWLMVNPLVTSPIIGPRSLEQLSDNLAALDIRLSGEDVAILESVSR